MDALFTQIYQPFTTFDEVYLAILIRQQLKTDQISDEKIFKAIELHLNKSLVYSELVSFFEKSINYKSLFPSSCIESTTYEKVSSSLAKNGFLRQFVCDTEMCMFCYNSLSSKCQIFTQKATLYTVSE